MKDFDFYKLATRSLWFMIGLLIMLLLIYGGTFILLKSSIQNDVPSSIIENAYSLTGSLGDSINGVFAPVVGIAAVITTFLAFLIQYEANQKIRKDTAIERFENKFYEMLRFHKENVNEIELGGKFRKRKVFVKIFSELRFVYSRLPKIDNINQRLKEIN